MVKPAEMATMNEALVFLAAPLAMCLILVGIHCYLGLHVLARGVVFVDLALAQVAALGTIVASLYGFDHSSQGSYFISLASTLLVAGFLATANRYRFKLSQEALIGVIYALSSSAVVLLIDKMSHGAEHLKHALVGQLLWVTWSDVGKVSLIYAAIGFIHYLYRQPLIQASFHAGGHWRWDFLFYSLFGVVITSSVHVAGVLLVFAFLIVPGLISSLFFQKISHRLFFGWFLGFILSALGMGASYWFDMPSGALIVVIFTILPVLLVLAQTLFQRKGLVH